MNGIAPADYGQHLARASLALVSHGCRSRRYRRRVSSICRRPEVFWRRIPLALRQGLELGAPYRDESWQLPQLRDRYLCAGESRPLSELRVLAALLLLGTPDGEELCVMGIAVGRTTDRGLAQILRMGHATVDRALRWWRGQRVQRSLVPPSWRAEFPRGRMLGPLPRTRRSYRRGVAETPRWRWRMLAIRWVSLSPSAPPAPVDNQGKTGPVLSTEAHTVIVVKPKVRGSSGEATCFCRPGLPCWMHQTKEPERWNLPPPPPSNTARTSTSASCATGFSPLEAPAPAADARAANSSPKPPPTPSPSSSPPTAATEPKIWVSPWKPTSESCDDESETGHENA